MSRPMLVIAATFIGVAVAVPNFANTTTAANSEAGASESSLLASESSAIAKLTSEDHITVASTISYPTTAAASLTTSMPEVEYNYSLPYDTSDYPIFATTATGAIDACEPNVGVVCAPQERPGVTGVIAYSYLDDGFQNPYGLRSEIPTEDNTCSLTWENALTAWLSTAAITLASTVSETTIIQTEQGYTQTEGYPIFTSTEIGGSTSWIDLSTSSTTIEQVGTTQALLTEAAYKQYEYVSDFKFTAAPPCCSSCTVYGGNVQVAYWPSTHNTTISTLVNKANFTYVYPSVYVAFASLYSSDLCSAGPHHAPTTIAFKPLELSTATGWQYDSSAYSRRTPILPFNFTQATWGTLPQESCTEITQSFWQVNQGSGNTETFDNIAAISSFYGSGFNFTSSFWEHFTVSHNPCNPSIAAPSQIYTIDPSWANCYKGIAGLYDPPTVLTPVPGLLAFSPTPYSSPATSAPTSTPAAGSTPSPSTATPTVTATPVPVPTNTPSQPIQKSPPTQPSSATANVPSQSSSLQNNSPAQSPSPVNQTPSAPVNSAPVQPATPAQSSPDPTESIITVSYVSQDAGSSTAAAQSAQPQSPGSPPANLPSSSATQVNPPVVVIGGSSITADTSSAFVIGSQTLTPGGVITVSSTPISYASNGGTIVMGSSSQIVTVNVEQSSSVTQIIIGSQTLIAGSAPVTISGTAWSLQADGSGVVAGEGNGPVTTIAVSDLQPFTAEYTFGSQIVTAGAPAVTISGTPVSLLPGGSAIVLGGNTEPVSAINTPGGIGGDIASIGGFATPTSTVVAGWVGETPTTYVSYNGTTYTALAAGRRGNPRVMGLALILGVVIVGFV